MPLTESSPSFRHGARVPSARLGAEDEARAGYLPGVRPGATHVPSRGRARTAGGTDGAQVADRSAQAHRSRWPTEPTRSSTTARGDRRDHELHEHLEPVGDDRRRAAGAKRGGARAVGQAVGQDQPGPGSKVVTEYLDQAGLMPYLEQLGLQPGRLRLHDLHRQQRPAAAEEIRRRSKENDLVVASVLCGNRNFEGRINPDVQRQLPGLAAAGGGLRAGRDDGHRPLLRAAGHGPRRRSRSTCRTSGRAERRSRWSFTRPSDGHVPRELRRGVHGDERWSTLPVSDGELFAVGQRLDLHPEPAILRGMTLEPAPPGTSGRARAGAARGQRDDRSHLAGGLDQDDSPAGRYLIEHHVEPRRTSIRTARGVATTR